MMSISVVLPCYNEESNIEATIRDVAAWFTSANLKGEIIVVNDGSKDGSAALLERLRTTIPNLIVIHHPVNQGYGAAIRSGCDAAKTDIVAFMDSDGQFKAADLANLLPHLKNAELVTGIRVHRADPLIRKLNSWLYAKILVPLFLGVNVKDLNCGMKTFRKSVWKTIRPVYASGALFNAELYVRLLRSGGRLFETPVPHYPRTAGNPTGANPLVILKMFRELFNLRRSLRHISKQTSSFPREQNETLDLLQADSVVPQAARS